MPRTRDLNRYPKEYAELILAAASPDVGAEGITLPFESDRRANSFKSIFYAFMRAYERATDLERREYHPGLNKLLVGQMYLSTEGDNLVMKNRTYSPTAMKIKAVLEAIGKERRPAETLPDPKRVLDRLGGDFNLEE